MLGPRIIVTEFAAGVFLCAALGAFVLVRGHGARVQFALGVYLILLGLNYVPMLIYAISIRTAVRARTELGSELDDKKSAMAKYRRQSLWLLVPLAVPLVAITQCRRSVVISKCS